MNTLNRIKPIRNTLNRLVIIAGSLTALAITSTATLTLTGSSQYGAYSPLTSGPEIFSSWIKSTDNSTPYNMVIGNLSSGTSYDLIIYTPTGIGKTGIPACL